MDYFIVLERVDDLCNKKGISRAKAFLDSGVGKDFATHITRGSAPSIEKIDKLSKYFNVSTDYLLGREDKNTENPATDRQLKFALFGDAEIDDELLDEVKYMAKVQQEMRKKKKEGK